MLLTASQLFLVPTILNVIEEGGPAGRLASVTGFFTLSLMLLRGASSYFTSCTEIKRIELRLHLAAMIQNKMLTTSYINTENQEARRKMDKAVMLVSSNTAATETIWGTLTGLLQRTAEFALCLSLLAALHPPADPRRTGYHRYQLLHLQPPERLGIPAPGRGVGVLPQDELSK